MATVRKNITLKEEEVIIFNDYCKKMDKVEGEEIAKIIKNIETDKDDKGVEITLDEILQGNL